MTPQFHLIVPGEALPGDWFSGRIPQNVVVGEDSVIDSSFCFKHFRATHPGACRIGSHVTLWRTSLSVESSGTLEIGDYCYLANASLACAQRITIGSYVFIAGGVTIIDSDFHPLEPAARLADTIALSPIGNRGKRIPTKACPVTIADAVWIGCNATLLKGIHVGTGAVVEPGSIVRDDVPPHTRVAGNPARPIGATAS